MSKRASTLIRRLAVVFAGFVVASLAQAQPVRIGAVYSISGPGSFLGAPEDKVLRALAEEANKKGGVNGHKIELVIYDTEGNTGKAAQQFRRLATSDDVQVVFGPSSSGESLAVKDLANELKVPTLMELATSIFSPASSRTAVSSKKDQASSSEVATFASLCWTA